MTRILRKAKKKVCVCVCVSCVSGYNDCREEGTTVDDITGVEGLIVNLLKSRQDRHGGGPEEQERYKANVDQERTHGAFPPGNCDHVPLDVVGLGCDLHLPQIHLKTDRNE